jgi:hypothetical protein
VLAYRAQHGLLGSGDRARIRREAFRAAREEAELLEALADLAARPGAPDLSLDDIRHLVQQSRGGED